MTGDTVLRRIRNSGLFHERGPQQNGSICFTLHGFPGASIYYRPYAIQPAELHFNIGTLKGGNFPNNERLLEFVRRNHHHRDSVRYRLRLEYIDPILRILRGRDANS